MHEDNTAEASALELRIKRMSRYMTIGIAGLLAMCVLLFFYIGSIKQSEQTSKTNTQIQAAETLDSDICKVYPNQNACITAKKLKENPADPIIPKDGEKGDKGDKGDRGNDGRGITTFGISDKGDLIVKYTDNTEQNAGHVVGKPGQNGKPGSNGTDGKDGKAGTAGINGIDGVNGRGILSSAVTDGALVIRYTDGTTENLGIVVGPKGEPGKDGTNGTNGTDGISVTNVAVTTDGTVNVSYSDGRTEVAGKIIVNTITRMVCENDTLSITVTDGSIFSATVDCSPDAIPGLTQ